MFKSCLKRSIKNSSKEDMDKLLYFVLTNNPWHPLTDNQAKLAIQVFKQLRKSNSYIMENELNYLLRKWESNNK